MDGCYIRDMKVSDILIEVKPVLPSDSLEKAISVFLAEDMDILPAVDPEGKFIGVLTQKRVLAALQEGAPFSQMIERFLDGRPRCLSTADLIDELPAAALPAVVLDGAGCLAGVVTTAALAAALQSAEFTRELRALQDINKELEAVIDSSYDGIWVTDGQGVILKVNKASERISGRPARAFVGRNMRELVERGLIDQSAALLVMEKSERVTINQTIKTANGEMVLLVTGNPIFDDEGKLFRIVTNTRDISELIRLRNQLSKEQQQSLKYMTELVQLRTLQSKDTDLIFRSVAMQRIVELSARVADVDSTVLITGESGTGKEMLARLIHRLGRGDKKPFITINCGAIPDQLLESELFGYEGGAFTGAKKEGKPGMFELAHSGTLFLDEVGELPLALQVKLLRALQEKEVVRVGGTKPVPIDARIITATNKDLALMLKEKAFREDLYYRLMVVPIHIPPLRERGEDIPPLVSHFIDEFNRHFGFRKTISPEVMDKLISHDWPGNVRELKNAVERMIVISHGNEVTPADLPGFVHSKRPLPKPGTRLKEAVVEMETYLLSETYKECGSWQKVAHLLGVDYTTVYRKVARYRLANRP